MSVESTYKCPHCGEVLDHVVVTGTVPLAKLSATEPGRINHRLTSEQLVRVMELHRTGGPDAIAAEFGVSVRQASRYIVKAREVLG